MVDLREFQAAFVRDLFRPIEASSASVLTAQPGFAIYRNTVMTACIDALAANYPTVLQLVGAECFREVAAAFAREHPPRTGVLAEYGAQFASFLTSVDAVSELEYLPAVATLDRLWTEAHCAADAPVLEAADFTATTPEQLSVARLLLHPAARWRAFESMPIYTLWRRHREGLRLEDDLHWCGEAALVTRPAGSVAWTDIAPDAALFLTSCASGRTFAEAMDDADASRSAGDASKWLPRLIHAGAFSRLATEAER